MKKMKEKEEDERKEERKKKIVKCGYTQSGEETRNSISKSTHNTSFSIERTKLNLMFKKGGWKKLVAGGGRKKGKK